MSTRTSRSKNSKLEHARIQLALLSAQAATQIVILEAMDPSTNWHQKFENMLGVDITDEEQRVEYKRNN